MKSKLKALCGIISIPLAFALACSNAAPPQPQSQPQAQAAQPVKAAWPALPQELIPPYAAPLSDLSKLKAGDSIPMPIPMGFRTITLTAALQDGVMGIKDLKENVKGAGDKTIKVTVKSLHTHALGEGKVSLVWHELSVQPAGGLALSLKGAYRDGKLVGYRYSEAALGTLKPGNQFAILEPEGWRVVKVAAALDQGVLKVEGSPKSLRLIESQAGEAGVAWE